MNKPIHISIRIILSVLFFGLLILVRFLGKKFMYDPLTPYFSHPDYSSNTFPEIDKVIYSFNLLIKYSINSLLSVGILYFLYQKREYITISLGAFAVLFPIAIGILLYAVYSPPYNYTLILFARRILMHPVLLLILIPAFFFQKRQEKVNE